MRAVDDARPRRTLKFLKSKKGAAHVEGMRVVVKSLVRALPAVVNVMIVLMLFLVIFGILGMQATPL